MNVEVSFGRTARALGLLLAVYVLGCGGSDAPAMSADDPETDAAVKCADTGTASSDAGHFTGAGSPPASQTESDRRVAPTLSVEPPVIEVAEGKLRGKRVGDTRMFLGIRYAKPPVGALRFAPPVPSDPWPEIRDATVLGPSCPQPPSKLAAEGPQDEDCLSLNVYTPNAIDAPLPVMVFLHGGGFVSGGSAAYDGQRLSEEGKVVIVTLNYRLGALGTLALSALDATRPANAPSGNDAFRDQALALRWVRANIARFGGDPAQVTLFGESAGAMSTCLHMVSPTTRDLAQRFIMESGVCVAGIPLNDRAKAEETGAALVAALCAGRPDAVACLRALPAHEIVAWGASESILGAGWGPSINPADPFLPEHPLAIIQRGSYSKGALIVGSNAREWGLFETIGASPKVTTRAELNAAIDEVFGGELFGSIALLVKLHYVDLTVSDAKANATWIRLMTDAVFRCPARMLARVTTDRGSKAYLYSFEEGRAHHAFELPYVFGNANAKLGAETLVEPLRAAMQSYWLAHARAGIPHADGRPGWPSYTRLADQHLTLTATPTVGRGLSQSDCDFWEPLQSL